MGNYVQQLSAQVSLIAADTTWMDGLAIQQMHTTATLPGIQKIVGMPDLHVGRGYPVGAAFLTSNTVYPALVGNDIGCGMSLWQTSLIGHALSLDKTEKRLTDLDHPLTDKDRYELLQQTDSQLINTVLGETASAENTHLLNKYLSSIGTIGGGNHFVELQSVDTIFDAQAFNDMGLTKQQVLLLVHSGSRGLGQAILEHFITKQGHSGLNAPSELARQYFDLHDMALRYAQLNRQTIARRFFNKLRCEGQVVLDVHHNFVQQHPQGYLHRKGATPAVPGSIVVIPGSRGDYSYLLKVPDPSTQEQAALQADTLHTLAHGAGRKWARFECEGKLAKKFTQASLSRTALGSRVICEDNKLIFEEAPQAYKDIDSVVLPLQAAGLVTLVAKLKPLLTYKTRGRCCS